MSLATKVTLLAQRIGAEIKALRSEAAAAKLYQPNSYLPGKPAANDVLLSVVAGVAASFPANFVGSYGTADTAATASTVCIVKKGATQVGTATFAAGAVTATFVLAGGVSLALGERLAIVAPTTPDATLAGVGFVLAGTRV